MKRLALVLAAFSVLGTGCYVAAETPRGSVDVGWRFARFAPGGTSPIAFYGCTTWNAAAGANVVVVDAVVVQLGSGAAQQFPCRDNVGDGALLDGLAAGQQTLTVIGRRGGVDLYRSSVVVNVVAGQVTPVDIDVDGIPDDLEVQTTILTANGAAEYTSCANAGFTTFTYKLVDSVGTLVSSGSASCTNPTTGLADPNGFPDLRYLGAGALDRDTYTIRLQAPATGGVTFDTASFPTNACSGQSFAHTGPDTGAANAWNPALYNVAGNGTLCR